jgi:hypothetical protein
VANINNGSSNIRIDSSGGNIQANVGGVANVFGITTVGANVSGNLAVTANVSANYFLGNGSQLTGINVSTSSISNGTSNVSIPVANGNVNTSVGGTANVLVVTTGGANVSGNLAVTANISANYFLGNGRELSGVALTTVSNTVPSSPDQGDIWIDSDSGIQYIYFTSSGNSQWAEMEADVSITSVDFTNVLSNIIPGANVTYDLGNSTNRWNDIWLANSTIHIGAANISAAGANLLLPNVVLIGGLTIDSTGNTLSLSGNITGNTVSVSGNVTANYLLGNGACLTGVITSVANINNGTSNIDIPTANGNILTTVGGVLVTTATPSGLITLYSNYSNTTATGNLTYLAYTNSLLVGTFTVDNGTVITVPDNAELTII